LNDLIAVKHRDPGLVLIALFRGAKALALVAVGIGLLKLMHPDVAQHVLDWLRSLPLIARNEAARRALTRVAHVPPRHLEIGAGLLFAYAGLFATEAAGLWLGKVWAEYLTITATASFIPFEAYELARRATLLRGAVLAANVAVVAYLAWHRRRARGRRLLDAG
jgi:uncharacterized membrane protein (DUF2068 family)